MASARRSIQDFMAQVNARTTTGVTYTTALNSDGSVQITRNGTIVYPKVQWYTGSGAAITDTNISGDSVTLLNNDGTTGRGDAQLFINSLV